jgi:hypothetical protein
VKSIASYLKTARSTVYRPPEALVTDSGSVFRANRAMAVYEALSIEKHEIEKGRPWQSYLETAFSVQRRMADWHFAKPLSRYAVKFSAGTRKPRAVERPVLFGTTIPLPQPRLSASTPSGMAAG